MENFSFSENEDVMVITTKDILNRKKDILFVAHDGDDGTWQFLDGDEVNVENAAIVSLAEIVSFDHTINVLFDLPLGGFAYRKSRKEKWIKG